MITDELKNIIEQAVIAPDKTDAPQIKPRYQLLTACDALQPQPPIDWLVDGLISAGSVNVFYGDGGSKKTWALLDMAVCVARGADWLNFKTKAGGVLIVDEESGKRRIMRRLGDVLRGHAADNQTPIYCTSLAAFNLCEPNDIGELYNLIVSSGARLVIVDALADVMPGKDENSVKDVQPLFLALRRIAEETQAAIIIIHHSSKNGGYRGSTAIKGALDLLLSVESKTGSDEIIFKTEKARDTTAGEFTATANFMTVDPAMFWLTPSDKTAGATFNKGQKYVLRYLLENGASPMNDITGNADSCSERTAKNSVYSLADMGFLTRTDGGGQGVKAAYDLTDKGKETAENL